MEDKKNIFEKIMEKNKKGNIDPRILFWILIAVLIYLFLKAIGLFK